MARACNAMYSMLMWKKKINKNPPIDVPTSPGFLLRTSPYGRTGQLMALNAAHSLCPQYTDLVTRIIFQPITHNVEHFKQPQEENSQLGGISFGNVSFARTWSNRRHAGTANCSRFMIPSLRVASLRFLPGMGSSAWSCGALFLLAIVCSCRAITLESIHWSSSNAK